MNRLSITSHYYTCENWIVEHLIAWIMTCLRTNLTSNDLIRGNTLFIVHPQTTLYALNLLKIKGRKDSFLCQVDIMVIVITRHVLLLCFSVCTLHFILLFISCCLALNKHKLSQFGETFDNLNSKKNGFIDQVTIIEI